MTYRNVIKLPTRAELFYKQILKLLRKKQLPFLIGGSIAMAHYMHLPRTPKDLDLFIRREDCPRYLAILEESGYLTEVLHDHWLAKVWQDELFIDLIFSSGNGLAQVDDSWFENSRQVRLFGMNVRICSAEDIIWSKAFIMDRERFDGADVAHLLRDAGPSLDWTKLLLRFENHWRILLSHLLLFQFIYPQACALPREIVNDLLLRAQLENRQPVPDTPVCRGSLLSRDQYQSDVDVHGYLDGRILPEGRMTASEVAEYMEFIRAEKERSKKSAVNDDEQAA